MGADAPAAPTRRAGLLLRELSRQERRRAVAASLVRILVSSGVLLVAYYVLPLAAKSNAAILVRVVVATFVVAGVTYWQIRAVNRAELPQIRAMEALTITVTLMVVVLASAYMSLSMRDASAFSEVLKRTGALYFTVTTLTTVGFGDIVAKSDAARVAVMLQMVFNVAVIGVAARLIIRTAKQRLGTTSDGG